MRSSFVLALCLLLGSEGDNSLENMEVDKTSAAINLFSSRFVKEVDTDSSTVSSPLSAEIVLGLVALGSSGDTHDEILKSLGFPDDNSVRTGFTAVSTKLKSVKGVTFDMANKVYVKSGEYELKPAFRSDAEKVFNAEVEKVNFNEGAAAANTINTWVEGKTNKKIKDLVKPDMLTPDTRLVLVNALYFKGTWKTKFDPSATAEMPFHVTSKKSINIPFMNIEKNYKYGHSKALNAKLLEIPYEGEEASMVIVLPDEVEGLSSVVKKLSDGLNLAEEQRKMASVKVKVSLPKFKIETEIDLKALLPKLGMKGIFDASKSQVDKMIDQPLFVSHAIQKAFIEVNEEGAEAAAATAVHLMRKSGRLLPNVEFTADRPFLFVLQSGPATLFTGLFRPQQ